MPPGRRTATIAVAVGLALGPAACDGEPDRDDPPPEHSPLTEFLGLRTQPTGGGFPLLAEDERQRQLAMEELIAQCMADQGFEYRPVPPEERIAGTFAEAYALPPAEFARQYGYGVTTLSAATGGAQPVDPNQEIRDRLSPQRLQEYEQALWGTGDDHGCQQRASTEVYGDPSELDEDFAQFQELLDAIGALYRQIEADPRLRAAATRWGECLADAGYPGFSDPNDARQSVFDRLSAVQGAGQPAPSEAELAAIRDYELALAPVDLACQSDHVDGTRQEVTVELEQEFIDAHRAELEQYRDWLAQTRSSTG